MSAGSLLVPAVGFSGLLAASATRRWAQRFTQRDLLLYRLRSAAGSGRQRGLTGEVPPNRRWVLLAPLLLVVPGLVAGVAAFALVIGLAGTGALILVRGTLHRGDPARYERGLMDCLDALARQLRSGASLPVGLQLVAEEATGPLRADLQTVHADLAEGQLFSVALHRWAARRPWPMVLRVVGGLGVGHESGALRARHVEALADNLRQDQQIRREASSWAAQAQASAWIMAVSPLAFSMLLAMGDPAVRTFLVHRPMGLACLSVGLALDLGAAAVMTHMVAVVR